MSRIRALNIAVRTAHLAVTGVLLGGHFVEAPAGRLRPVLYLAILTGALLVLIEAGGRWRWVHQGRGVLVLAKLALLCVIPFAWPHRFAILTAIVVLASVGSHMPARYRYYSVVYRQLVKD
jgi:hypothetical protein